MIKMNFGLIIIDFFYVFALIYIEAKLLKVKINFKSFKLYLALVFLTVFISSVNKNLFQMIALFQFLNIINLSLYYSKENTPSKITLATIISYFILVLIEKCFSLSFVNPNIIISYVALLTYIFIFTRPLVYNFINKLISKFKSNNSLFIIIYYVFIMATIIYLTYFNPSQKLKLILLFLISLDYFYLFIILIVIDRNKEKDLDFVLEITNKYEKIINDIRIKNHENKNQLLVLKGLIDKENKPALNYIDSILKLNYTDDEKLLLKVACIPAGALKGLIYYKLLMMKNKNIECSLEVSKSITPKVIKNINEDAFQKFCQIIGVFIDNAIEAVILTKKKIIFIEIFIENDFLIFKILNEFKGKIDTNSLGNRHYTTKGENRGYGLQLVNKLVKNDNNLIKNTEVIDSVFLQKIGIKLESKSLN